ncbi:unnamed protein product [Didymodactylos carnosus]|uniref:Potassium channel tetramerisation-type BTB domain-containing protein n=1 Tax=Didymodactylos carnosus TaxID=1234261 RepID=A0A814ZYY4_9BILA|nr:unnamed protein product [Didymodactylos carnosus]CAF1250357.1 unnamed protein product [Didymodactylos carnosus]CAF3827440.1 unnamed protein product [Didymodactylos carnosus]CAF4019263.1 unnamed protein product [Didymodactylos carnosus]
MALLQIHLEPTRAKLEAACGRQEIVPLAGQFIEGKLSPSSTSLKPICAASQAIEIESAHFVENMTKFYNMLVEYEETKNEMRLKEQEKLEALFERNDLISLNIRGEVLYTSRSTLVRIHDTKLSTIFEDKMSVEELKQDGDGHIFFDYNPNLLRELLTIVADCPDDHDDRRNGLFRSCSDELKIFARELGFQDYYIDGSQNSTERFSKVIGYGAVLTQDKCCASHTNKCWWNQSHPIVIGKNLYTQGISRLQLFVAKRHSRMFIGIVSSSFVKQSSLDDNNYSYPSIYGWNDNSLIFNGYEHPHISNVGDFLREGDTIEMEINCLDKTILVLNKRSRRHCKILVDINHCPFPWMLRIRLFHSNDQICLL